MAETHSHVRAAIFGIGTALPPRSYTQDEVYAMAGYRRKAVQAIFRNSAIERRHMAIEPDYRVEGDPEWFSAHYARWAPRLAREAAEAALRDADVEAREIDYVVATSCTGYICPGLSQILARDLGLGPLAKTANLVGMGCSAMVPALERATEFAERHPRSLVLAVAAEVSTAAYWVDDHDVESVVGNAIFADGASAAVLGAGRPGASIARVEAFATVSDRARLDYMGFYNRAGRLKVMLSRDVPEAVLPLAERAVAELLAPLKMNASDVASLVVHPGGRKILELAESRWGAGRLRTSWEVLASYGNMSSATILFVLDRHRRGEPTPVAGERAVVLSMGPGLSVEGALLRWEHAVRAG